MSVNPSQVPKCFSRRPAHDDHGKRALDRGDPRRLGGAREVARVDRGERGPRPARRQHSCLPASLVVQWDVGVALNSSLAIPVRLPVTDDMQGCRHCVSRYPDAFANRLLYWLARGSRTRREGRTRHRLEPRHRPWRSRSGLAREGVRRRVVPPGVLTISKGRWPKRRLSGSATGVVADVTDRRGRDSGRRRRGRPVRRHRHRRQQRRRLRSLGRLRRPRGRPRAAASARTSSPAFNVSQAALPIMRDRGGGVIGFDRVDLGTRGRWGAELQRRQGGGASASRRRWRAISRRTGIRVFSVAPGCVRHPGGAGTVVLLDDPEGMAAFVEREIPAGRFGTVDEVADVVTFLSSPRASWVIGACVTIDGGQSRSL